MEAPRARRRVVVDDRALADRIGGRLRAARRRAGLTQQKLAGDRYTKTYVSALEHGLAKPSLAALEYFALRLGLPASHFMTDEATAVDRLTADLRLAAGNWQEAADAYRGLLPSTTERGARAEILRGVAESLARLDQGAEAAAAAGEAVALFEDLGREADAALAGYWLSYAIYEQGNTAEARAILEAILAKVRAGLAVEPDLKLRILMALSSNASRDGEHAVALAYLEELRGQVDDLDDRRRATYLFDLAYSYRETGDYEAAIRAGSASLALFRAVESEAEMAALENDLALSFMAVGNLARATELAARSRARYERSADEFWLAHVTDTQARIALAEGLPEKALALAETAIALAEGSHNAKALIAALLGKAQAHLALDDPAAASACYERAAEVARSAPGTARVREVLGAWADLLARQGQHQRAYELTREALGSAWADRLIPTRSRR